jgi:hypothetical protein
MMLTLSLSEITETCFCFDITERGTASINGVEFGLPEGIVMAEELLAQRDALIKLFKEQPTDIYEEAEAAPVYLGERQYPAIVAEKFLYELSVLSITVPPSRLRNLFGRLSGLEIDDVEDIEYAAQQAAHFKMLKRSGSAAL